MNSPRVHLDTHAAVLLWEGRVDAFGKRSRRLLERDVLAVSAIVRLELQFLRETERIAVDPNAILGALAVECGVQLLDDPFARTVARSLDLSWTRDPSDRLIVASAIVHDARLITRDRRITANCAAAVW